MNEGKININHFSEKLVIWLIQLKILTNINLSCYRMGPYFVSPLVAGLDKVSDTEWRPVVANYDSIGCMDTGGSF